MSLLLFGTLGKSAVEREE